MTYGSSQQGFASDDDGEEFVDDAPWPEIQSSIGFILNSGEELLVQLRVHGRLYDLRGWVDPPEPVPGDWEPHPDVLDPWGPIHHGVD